MLTHHELRRKLGQGGQLGRFVNELLVLKLNIKLIPKEPHSKVGAKIAFHLFPVPCQAQDGIKGVL